LDPVVTRLERMSWILLLLPAGAVKQFFIRGEDRDTVSWICKKPTVISFVKWESALLISLQTNFAHVAAPIFFTPTGALKEGQLEVIWV
jgi:hypothetical protein